MSKQNSGRRAAERTAVPEKQLVPAKFETPILIILILVLLIIFLNKAFFANMVFASSDITASQSLSQYLAQAKSEGIFPLWIPYIFSGMPSFASLMTGGIRWYDLVANIWGGIDHFVAVLLVNRTVGWVTVYYFVFGIGLFLLSRRLGLTKLASFFGAVAAVFSTFIIDWIMAGHNTKIAAMAFFPFIVMLVIDLKKEFSWTRLMGLVIALHLQFASTHVQMIFYSFLALAIYFIYMIVRTIRKSENLGDVMRAGLLLVAGSLIALTMSADTYLSTYQYSKYSIRGTPPLVQMAQGNNQAGTGLDYEYATNWSFSPKEIASFLVPSFYGFGDIEYKGPLSNNQTVHPNTYFGPEPFMEASPYMGIIVLLLAFVGFIRNRKKPFAVFSLIVIVFALLVSFGREFGLVYNLMFDYFPYFNKFRSPNMILVLVQIFVAILSAYGLTSIAEARENSDLPFAKKMTTAAGVFAGLLFLALIMRGPLQDYYAGVIQSGRFANAPEQVQNLLFNNMMNDLYVSLFICMATSGLAALYIRRKVTTLIAGTGFVLILLFDLWRVDSRPMQMVPAAELKEQFATPDYVNFIKQDSTLYRVVELQNDQAATSNDLAYYLLQDAGGYSAAKIRIYQDMIDVDGLTNPNIMRLLGIKYIVTDKPEPRFGRVVFAGSRAVEQNSNILPRAFFVDNYKVAPPLETLLSMKDSTFDPSKTVYFLKDPGLKFDPPDTGAYAKFLDYKIQSMKIRVNATGNNFLLLSEVYYPAGWDAYIDGKPAEIYRVDYFLRGIMVPKGVHEIDLKFQPEAYTIGKDLSLASNGLVLLALVVVGAGFVMKRQKKEGTQEESKPL